MAEQMRPASPEQAPDPSNNYERSHPEREAGMGRLDNNQGTPTKQPDQINDAVPNAQDGTRQMNGRSVINQTGGPTAPDVSQTDQREPAGKAQLQQHLHDQPRQPPQPDHSMHDEEPMGWDQAPKGEARPEDKRHPRVGGKGGTPDVGDATRGS